ncbi:hypothetical protein [Pseudomonas asiatica]|uniref:Uncharacterized protein n=1 Tax=Pseudomonas asiatica TaxID=2219225 RepID=A0AAJ5LEJ5_9PSED|nr:hypothetical protein [Pseudomonas asiatica]UUC20772.1 hypothetical protein NOV18_09945 [Pseudomonas asiatica]WPX87697.1 hypothetical protein PsasTeo6_15248 [Pseudomonas asiatica]
MIEDIQQDIDVTVKLEDFIRFLTNVGRSSKCPVCPHDGEWLFYIDQTKNTGMASPMAVTDVITKYAEAPSDTYPVFTMECPNCGFLTYTNANLVVKKLKENSNG